MGRLECCYNGQTQLISDRLLVKRLGTFTLRTAKGELLDAWALHAGLTKRVESRGIMRAPSLETDDTYRARLEREAISQWSTLERYRPGTMPLPIGQCVNGGEVLACLHAATFDLAYDHDPGAMVAFARDVFDPSGETVKAPCSPTDYIAAGLSQANAGALVAQLARFHLRDGNALRIPNMRGGIPDQVITGWSAENPKYAAELAIVTAGVGDILERHVMQHGSNLLPGGVKTTELDMLAYVSCIVQCPLCARWAGPRDRVPGSMFCWQCGQDLLTVGRDLMAEEINHCQARGMMRPSWFVDREDFFQRKVLQA